MHVLTLPKLNLREHFTENGRKKPRLYSVSKLAYLLAQNNLGWSKARN